LPPNKHAFTAKAVWADFAGFLLRQVRVPKYACHQQRASPANFSKVDSSHGQTLAVEFIQELVEGCTKLYLVVPDSLLFCLPQWGEHLSLSLKAWQASILEDGKVLSSWCQMLSATESVFEP